MELVCSPAVCPDLQLPAFLEFARTIGLSRVELCRDCCESSPVHPDFSVRMVRNHLQLASVLLTGLNVRELTGRKADSDERNLSYNLRQLQWDIHLGRALGVKTVALRGGARTAEAMDDLIEGVNQLLDGIPDVTLNLGSAPQNRLEGLADFESVMCQVGDRARVLLDTGRLLDAGESPLHIVEAFAGRIGLVHLGDRRDARPVPVGEGDLPVSELLDLLRDSGYDGLLVLAPEAIAGTDPVAAVLTARACLLQELGRL